MQIFCHWRWLPLAEADLPYITWKIWMLINLWDWQPFRKGYYSVAGSSVSGWPGSETLSRSHTGTCFHQMLYLWGKNKCDEKIFLSLSPFSLSHSLFLTLSVQISPCRFPFLSLPVENVVNVDERQSEIPWQQTRNNWWVRWYGL